MTPFFLKESKTAKSILEDEERWEAGACVDHNST